MACKIYEDLIDKYVEGLVTAEEKNILEEHIKVCSDCRQEVKELQQIIKTAGSLEQIELPPNFAPSLMEKINSIASEQRPVDKSSRFIRFLRSIPAFISNSYYYNKKAFTAVMSVFIIGVFVVTLSKMGILSMDYTKNSSINDEAPQISAPAAESYEMRSSEAQVENESFDGAQDVNTSGRSLKTFAAEEREQKIIKNADISIYVENFDEKVDKIINFVDELGGYIESSQIDGSVSADSSRRAYITIRIPQGELTKALDMFKAMGKVSSQHIGGENITEAYYDTAARVRNLEQQEQRLLEILQMAKSVDEVLKIENELNRVRTDVDTLTGQLVAWDKMVEMSLVNLNLIEQEPSKEKLGTLNLQELFRRAKQGFIIAINFLLNILASLAEVVGALLPIAIAAGVLFKCIYSIIKRFTSRKKKG
ncbi:DUF4349 domain-containing protein [Tepidanaerobacter acetatoxydans]|uniref:DUF4349 domain-containing protein n=1 Tax=Tepidanaerobacter acetatoxydans TaxID=499229 RepID=UPI001BD3BA43